MRGVSFGLEERRGGAVEQLITEGIRRICEVEPFT
jgi:hypothetical protein